MILVCNNFEYDGKSLTGLKLSSVNFDDDTTLPSSLSREMESSTMNKYRPETNGFGIKYTESLNFDIYITKDTTLYGGQDEFEFTPDEYENIVAWLTSPNQNKWLKITTENNKECKVKGYFSSVTPYDNWGICYGIKCTFNCNSPFSYVEKTLEKTASGILNFLVNNESSERYDYVYPVIKIHPTQNEDIFLHNMSDSQTIDSGTLSITSDNSQDMELLIAQINNYAKLHGLTVEYMYEDDGTTIKTICDKTAILFYFTDKYGVKNKYAAYYLESNGNYYLVRSGFFYCKLLKELPIEIDCKNLSIYDEIQRPVVFETIGIQDEDEIYWMRFVYGNNSMCVRGHFDITIDYLEPRKGMLI